MIQSAGVGLPTVPIPSGDAVAAGPALSPRNLGIDALRYGLAFLVVLIHSLPDDPAHEWAEAIRFACRSAVPFFFIAGGYFLPRDPVSAIDYLRKPIVRLAPVYALWMGLYLLYFTLHPVGTLISSPKDLITGGGAFHLWFLPALGFGLASVGLGVRFAGPWITGVICLGLAALSFATSSYGQFIDPAMDARSGGGLLIAPIFIFIGHMIALHGLRMKPLQAAGLFVIANLLLIAEEHFIWQATNAPQLVSHDFVASTIPLGLSLFLLAQSLPAGKLLGICAGFGKLAAGIYFSHLMVLLSLSHFTARANAGEVFALAVATFLISTVAILALRRSPRLIRFVG